MDFVEATKQLLLEDFVAGVTHPRYKLQRVGELSQDDLGYIWQSNVFGHYVLVRYVSGTKFQKLETSDLLVSPARTSLDPLQNGIWTTLKGSLVVFRRGVPIRL